MQLPFAATVDVVMTIVPSAQCVGNTKGLLLQQVVCIVTTYRCTFIPLLPISSLLCTVHQWR